MDYNKTLNLPKTDFPMRAALPQREPDMAKNWDESGRYQEIIKRNTGKPKYILHDGPPYALSLIHIWERQRRGPRFDRGEDRLLRQLRRVLGLSLNKV